MTSHPATEHLTGRVHRRQKQLLDRISREERVDRSTALRKVLDIGIKEYMKRKVVEDYKKGRISVGKAAEEAEVSLVEFHQILAAEGVPIKLDMDTLRPALESDLGA